MKTKYEQEISELSAVAMTEERNVLTALRSKLNRELETDINNEKNRLVQIREERISKVREEHETNIQVSLRGARENIEQECQRVGIHLNIFFPLF